jgi:SAM-dependent methyltransferase
MGFYEERILPRLVDLTCGTAALDGFRRATTAGLAGTVLEVGFGSGTNLPHLPAEVVEILAVEPSATASRLATRRCRDATAAVRHVGLDGEAIELGDQSCDHALVTFALCTIPDPSAALVEVRRILRPGGTLHVLEHGRAPDPSVARWQDRLDPLERAIAGGCHLTRDPVGLVEGAGFEICELEQRYGRGPKPWSYFTRLVADVAPPA